MSRRVEVQCLECGYRGWGDLVDERGPLRVHNLPLAAWCVHRDAAYIRVVELDVPAMLIASPQALS